MRKFLVILVISASVCVVQSQVFREFNSGFKTIFINPSEVNSYYFGFNPALLDFSSDDELLVLSTNVNIDDGKFKRFIDPISNRLYQLTASGKKSIDSSQRFKGSFAFQRYERKGWNWIFTKDYQTGNPFLIGDSTSGDSRINGIKMRAEYSNKLFDNFLAGFYLDYSVDEMLKEVSPRPTSSHRDIHSRMGLNYCVIPGLNIGFIADVYDKNEEISYREDEGSITQETIILKFKGYDFPNILRKKTETRYSYINGYAGGMTISLVIPNKISTVGYFISGFDKTNIKDDAIDPQAEGFWMNNYFDAGVQISALLDEQIQAGLVYNFHKDDGWAKYPPYNVLYFERELNSHSVIAGLKYSIDPKISAGLEGGINMIYNDEQDHYSSITDNVNSNICFGRIGLGTEWNDEISSIISYGYYCKSVPEHSITSNEQSGYFGKYRKYDLIYLHTGYYKHDISLVTKIASWFGGIFYIHLNYSSTIPKSGSEYDNELKNEFNSIIEYRVKVF
jgi:hypothetical protein